MHTHTVQGNMNTTTHTHTHTVQGNINTTTHTHTHTVQGNINTTTTRPTNNNFKPDNLIYLVDSSWNVMAHGYAQKGKWRGNCRMEWVASTLHTTSEYGVSSITTAHAHTSAAGSRQNWRPPADLNGLVRFAERLNLVSVRVPSHFKWPLHLGSYVW